MDREAMKTKKEEEGKEKAQLERKRKGDRSEKRMIRYGRILMTVLGSQ